MGKRKCVAVIHGETNAKGKKNRVYAEFYVKNEDTRKGITDPALKDMVYYKPGPATSGGLELSPMDPYYTQVYALTEKDYNKIASSAPFNKHFSLQIVDEHAPKYEEQFEKNDYSYFTKEALKLI